MLMLMLASPSDGEDDDVGGLMLIEKDGDYDEGIKLKIAWIQSEALALFQIGQKRATFWYLLLDVNPLCEANKFFFSGG